MLAPRLPGIRWRHVIPQFHYVCELMEAVRQHANKQVIQHIEERCDVIVIGAGLAGLTAALALVEQGYKVEIAYYLLKIIAA